jgi:hypothetical protein
MPQPLAIHGAGVQPGSDTSVPHQLPPEQFELVVIYPEQFEYQGIIFSIPPSLYSQVPKLPFTPNFVLMVMLF